MLVLASVHSKVRRADTGRPSVDGGHRLFGSSRRLSGAGPWDEQPGHRPASAAKRGYSRSTRSATSSSRASRSSLPDGGGGRVQERLRIHMVEQQLAPRRYASVFRASTNK